MFDLDPLVIPGHEKVIEHYRRLRDSAASAAEREKFQERMNKEEDLLHIFLARRPTGGQRAA